MEYNYLCILFKPSGIFTSAINLLCKEVSKAMFCIRKLLYSDTLNVYPHLKLFDSNTSKAPRERKVNFTFTESNLISELVTEQLNLVKGKHSMEVTNIKKQGMWADVTRRVNALGVCLRTDRSEEQVEEYVKRGKRKVHTRKKRKVKDRGWSCTTGTNTG
jgi:hypothetical protein